MIALVTGASGFLGRNLCLRLGERPDTAVVAYDLGTPEEVLEEGLRTCDIVFHLAGVNRPQYQHEFHAGNVDPTRHVCERLAAIGRRPPVVFSSSVQAELDNAYGASKRVAEDVLRSFCERTGGSAVVHRLKNLFGKWCRPNYNSVTATFCHNVARDLAIEISDPAREIDLTYVDDVVEAFVSELDGPVVVGYQLAAPLPSVRIALGELAALIRSFGESRRTLLIPDFSSRFVRALYATYLSYLPAGAFRYGLDIRTDARGTLAEFVKSSSFGQVFVSRTRPGIRRGDHYHHTKTEKFLVVEGQAIVRFRHTVTGEVHEYRVAGERFEVVDIPPGYTHSIENVGSGELVTLFWASEVFDPARPDTRPMKVLPEGEAR